MPTARVVEGDALVVLRTLPDESVHCCVTSPPYWGLRDYGVAGQLGLEKTPEEYVAGMVAVFAEVRRVLRADGTAWVNLGDTYNSSPSNQQGEARAAFHNGCTKDAWASVGRLKRNIAGLKPKDLVGIPWRVAFALQADGWYLRSDIIWHKPNPMPESVTDRPTKAHEYIFLLAKSERYHYDADAIKEACLKTGTPGHLAGGKGERAGTREGLKGQAWVERKQDQVGKRTYTGFNDRWDESEALGLAPMMRNRRDVWTVATHPFPEAHFATFPPALVEPCILAGCPEGGTVLDPFNGAGTTGMVACRLGREYIGIELNPEYADMARRRITEDAPMFNQVEAVDAIMPTPR